MPHKSSHVRGASVKSLATRKANIQAIADDGGISFEQAERIYDSSLGYGEGNVTIFDGNNADNLTEKKVLVDPGFRGKGKKYNTV